MSEKIYVQVGVKGRALPPGGKAGDILQKASADDFDLQWTTPAGGASSNIPQPWSQAMNPDSGSGAHGDSVSFAPGNHYHPLRVPTTGFPKVDQGTGVLKVDNADDYYAYSTHAHPLNLDSTDPEDIGTKTSGTSTVYARRDHVHELPLNLIRLVYENTLVGTDSTISATPIGSGITGATVNKDTFETKITATGTYDFSYDGADWSLSSETVTLTDYGISVTGTAANGDTVRIAYTAYIPAFIEDETYVDFPYRAAVQLTGALASMIPEVTFGVVDAATGLFAAACESYNGGVYIYCRDQHPKPITIPTIILWRTE